MLAKKKSRRLVIPLAMAAVLVLLGARMFFKDTSGPDLTLVPEPSGPVSAHSEFVLKASDSSGVGSIYVILERDGLSMPLPTPSQDGSQTEAEFAFSLGTMTLPDGPFKLIVQAVDNSYARFGKGNVTVREYPLTMDTTAPVIRVKTTPPLVRRGGTGAVVYTVSEETSRSGVMVGDLLFPGFRKPDGSYVCLFPYPYVMEPDSYHPEIMAEDTAGNVSSSSLLINAVNAKFRKDTVNITDAFIKTKSDVLAALCPEKTSPVEQYVCANDEQRGKDEMRLLGICSHSASSAHWDGDFMRLPRSAVSAGFGDDRTYKYKGEAVNRQTHTGMDLASVKNADVPAANDGTVVFCGDLGIYGNTLVIDHGLNLFTLYAQLSEFSAETGAAVKRGDVIGKTGRTGLAGGDHVHLGFLIGGVPVQPLEWLDNAWIRNNISSRMAVQ